MMDTERAGEITATLAADGYLWEIAEAMMRGILGQT